MPPRNRNQQPPLEPGEEPLPVMDSGLSWEQLQAMNGVNMTEEDMVAAGMVPDAVASDLADAPAEVRRAEPTMQPTGAVMDLGFIQQINNAATDEEAKAMYDALDPALRHVYDRSYGMQISPQWAAQTAQEFYKAQEAGAAKQSDPRLQAIAANNKQKQQAALDTISNMRGTVNSLLQHPGFSGSVGAKNWAYLFGAFNNPVSGTSEADFKALLEQVQGGAFLQAFESLKGGGQITQIEGEKATQAIVRAQQSQSEEGFKKSMNDFMEILNKAEKRALSGETVQQPAAAPAAQAAPTSQETFTFKGYTYRRNADGTADLVE